MNARRWSSRLSSGAVALIAAIASYSHMRSVALEYGQTPLIATLLPLSVDGLVIVGAVAIGDGREHTWSAWLSFWAGVGASIAANVLAARPDLIARLISAWPAVALLLVVEVITKSTRGRAKRGSPGPATVSPAVAEPTVGTAADPGADPAQPGATDRRAESPSRLYRTRSPRILSMLSPGRATPRSCAGRMR